MKKSTIKCVIDADIKTVYDIVTDNENSNWRSDIEKIEIIDENNFVEYYPNGNYTEFTIMEKIPNRTYAFYMENNLFTGSWIGIFEKTEDGKTEIEFTEEIYVRNSLMRMLAKFLMNIKKMQMTYVEDLKKRVEESK